MEGTNFITNVNFINMTIKNNENYAVPFSHKTFTFGSIVLDSDFDSGNLFNAERINNQTYNLWLAVDHPKNQYRTWFHFSIDGLKKNTLVTFNIKNMQNQSRLLNEGLVPVYREQSSTQWKRVAHRVDVARIEYNEGWIEWAFKHTVTADCKVFFAFFYPWSNQENHIFLNSIQEKCKKQQDIYFKRSTIIRSLEGRPVEFITISSKKGLSSKGQQFDDSYLFPEGGQPKQFLSDKKAFVIGARVHPGEVPSSHVMTGILSQLTEDSEKARILRDRFIFYIFPIFNPDGVSRGAYRVDPNGINLNRCYINPNPKLHSPIYAVKKVILHFHHKNKYFGFLDLHAHAARKGVFIYGNSSNELMKQTQICLFPKILSMNSQIFEYQGSNFTERNMYCKDINDHVSKEGAGRVALFKATKNPYSWTLECNYNSSRVLNVIEERRDKDQPTFKISDKQLDTNLIVNYKNPAFKQPKEFYTIESFRQLGKQICESLLDLIELNPESRIDNPNSYFKSVQNLKLNLAVALLRMAPNRFESQYKKIYHYIEGPSSSKELMDRSVRALYLMMIRNAKIENFNAFLKEGDQSSVVFPARPKRMSMSPVRQHSSPKAKSAVRPASKDVRIRVTVGSPDRSRMLPSETISDQMPEESPSSILKIMKVQQDHQLQLDSNQSQEEPMSFTNFFLNSSQHSQSNKKHQSQKVGSVLNSHLLHMNVDNSYQRILNKNHELGLQILRSYRKSHNNQSKKVVQFAPGTGTFRLIKSTVQELPLLQTNKLRAMVSIASMKQQAKILRKRSNRTRNMLIQND